MRIAINAISAHAGGARTYVVNLARSLPALGPHDFQLYVPAGAAGELEGLPENFQVLHFRWAESSYAARLWWEQFWLPRHLKRWRADVLICTGNFCPLHCSVPVLLLSWNALYFTPRFLQDLLARRHYLWAVRHRLMTRLAVWSARAATLTTTPTDAMGSLIREAAGAHPPALRTIPHGFEMWPGAQPAAEKPPSPPFRFLVVSHYNYFRNFETVLRAFAVLRRMTGAGQATLTLTTQLRPGLKLGGYDTTGAARLIGELGLGDSVFMLGAVPYRELPCVYASAHAVICPSYSESFSYTVIEAMAMGTPVIASDIAVHREVAGDAALFFSALDAADLAGHCRSLMDDAALRERLKVAGLARVRAFNWRRHFEGMLAAAAGVAGRSLTAAA